MTMTRRGAARRRGDGRMGIGMGMGLGAESQANSGLQEGREELEPEVRTAGGTEMEMEDRRKGCGARKRGTGEVVGRYGD